VTVIARCVFWVSAALIVYTYAGYAAWLWIRARLRPWPVRRGAYENPVSIVMVVRNEERVLEEKLRNLLALDFPAEQWQIVVVSDGSTDGTESILREYAKNPRVHVVMNQMSSGKACGLNDAVTWAEGDIVVFTDARQKIEAGAIRRLLENFADPDVGAVSGELMLGDINSDEAVQGMGLYWKIEKAIRELESAAGSVVGATGALYAVRRNLLVPFPPDTILDDVYLPMHVVRQGSRVIFEPRARAWDVLSLGADREFRRKVRTLSGNYQLLQLAPWILTGSNPIRFEFVSHKLMRLLVPFALFAVLLSSALLPHPFYRLALVLQLAFYGLAVLGMLGMKRGVVFRVADAALTFVVLNTAAVVAFSKFVTGRKAVWNS
jgi:cellulose synthase/poly-beta-1,6-N-acetylglucosamine synthase-like glycosyltransferase